LSSDGTPYRTLISYKETWSPGASIDPSSEWTGTFRDPRLSPPAVGGGNPENSLTGQLFKVDDVGANLQSITVPMTTPTCASGAIRALPISNPGRRQR
jgi:hypothetical protein